MDTFSTASLFMLSAVSVRAKFQNLCTHYDICTVSGVAMSQTMPGHSLAKPDPSAKVWLRQTSPGMFFFCCFFVCLFVCLFVLFWSGGCWGHAPLVNFCISEVATQLRMPSVLNQE